MSTAASNSSSAQESIGVYRAEQGPRADATSFRARSPVVPGRNACRGHRIAVDVLDRAVLSHAADQLFNEERCREILRDFVEVALKLAATFRTTPEFWLNAQKAVDLWTARRTLRKLPKPLVRAAGLTRQRRTSRGHLVDQDTLYLLRPEFADPAYPNRRFYCRDCALLEGLLASFRASTTQLDVQRIDWSRPRAPVVDLLGAENQWLPVLILATDGQAYLGAREYAGHRFINDMTELLRALATRHGFPEPHP